MAVALAKRRDAARAEVAIGERDAAHARASLARAMAPSQRYVRGIFSGGTFCFEAQLVHRRRGHRASSNTPTAGNATLDGHRKSQENTIIDMGDDEFTQGRPHPMIDPSLRDARIREEVADPTTAVVLFDVVLGYGSAADPTAGLLGVIGAAKAKAQRRAARSRSSATSAAPTCDPQNRDKVVAGAASPPACWWPRRNAEAATWSAAIIVRADREPSMKTLFQQDLKVVNVGLQGFADNIAAAGGRPPT